MKKQNQNEQTNSSNEFSNNLPEPISDIGKIVNSEATGGKNNRNIQIVAGAGSGKTETITQRIEKLLLVDKIDPKNIVAFTFTDKAAEILKSRVYQSILHKKLNKLSIKLQNMFIGTIHSYCKQILQDNYNFGNYMVLDEVKEKVYLQKIGNQLNLDYNTLNQNPFKAELPDSYSKRNILFLKTVNIVYNEEIKRNLLKRYAPGFCNSLEIFETKLAEDKLLIFPILIKEAVLQLENDRTPIKDLKYLFVDEFHDINPAQMHLISLLGKNSEVCIVGDIKQAIYHWRGSRMKFFKNFPNSFLPRNCETFKIKNNWRSLQNIVEFANSFIKSSKINYFKLYSEAKRNGSDGFIGKIEYHDARQEAQNTIAKIKQIIDSNSGYSYRNIAILLRSVANNGDLFIKECIKQNIPYIIGGKIGLFRRDEIQAIVRFIIWLNPAGKWKNYYKFQKQHNNDDSVESGDDLLKNGLEYWKEACDENKIHQSFPKEELKSKLLVWKQETLQKINELNKNLTQATISDLEQSNILKEPELMDFEENNGKFASNSVESQEIINSPKLKNPGKSAQISAYNDYLSGKTYLHFYNDLLVILGIRNLNFENKLHQVIFSNFGRFSNILNDFEFTHKIGGEIFHLDDYFVRLNSFLMDYQPLFEETTGEEDHNIDAVKICTIHHAKGLEWDIVFLPSLVTGVFPTPQRDKKEINFISIPGLKTQLYDSENYKTTLEDEKRLFYVAITRARDVLLLSSYKFKPAKKGKGMDRVRESKLFQNVKSDTYTNLKSNEFIVNYISTNKKPSSKPSEPSSSEIEQYSITELVDYKKCPMFYQFRHVWEYGSLMNRFLGYGKLLHHILRRIMEQENLDLSNPRLLREKLHALMLIDFKLPYLNIEMNGKIRDSAEEKLYSYIYQFRDEMCRMKSVETRLEFIDKNVIIKGVADIIFDEKIGEINDESNGNIKGIHIRDYKTRDQHLGKLHEFQIGLYAAAFDKMDMSVLGGSIGYLRELKNEEVTINPEIIAQITKEAEEIIDHIRNNEFQPSFSQNQGKKCDNDKCDHYNICKYSNFEQD